MEPAHWKVVGFPKWINHYGLLLVSRLILLMARKKDLYYIMPGTKRGAQMARRRNITLSIIVGVGIAGLLAALIYFKDSF